MKLFNRNATPAALVVPVDLPPAVSIAELKPRSLAHIRGTVVRIRTIPRTGLPSLAATIEDETGRVVAIWSGRRAIGGVTLGRHIDLHGIAVEGRHELEFHNPEYTLR